MTFMTVTGSSGEDADEALPEESVQQIQEVFNNPSNIDENEKIDIDTKLWGLITQIRGNNAETIFYPDYLMYKNQLKMDDEEKTGYKIRGHQFSFVLFSIALLTSTLVAYRLHWLCDDAFITFRYSYNLHKGIGPIYNLGEEVEGYTNFLWMILISTGLNFNISPERSSQALGLLSYVLNLVLLFVAGKKIHESKFGKDKIYLPLSMICFSIQYHARVYATSGLETSFFTFLLLSGNLIIYFYVDQIKLWIGFTLLTLLCMTRPDGLLFYGFSSIFFLFFRFFFRFVIVSSMTTLCRGKGKFK
jgi:hypothetical protein